jgi:hypothetical protein
VLYTNLPGYPQCFGYSLVDYHTYFFMTHHKKNNLPKTGHKSAKKNSVPHPVRVRHSPYKETKPELFSEEAYFLTLQSLLPF